MTYPKNFAKLTTILLVCAVLCLHALQAFAADKIQSIRAEGAQRIETATIITYMGVKEGDEFNAALLDQALKNLYATGLFSDVALRQDGTSLVVTVAENPVINEIRYEGNKKIKTEDIQTEMQLKPRQVLTRTRVQTDVERLQDMYRSTGRFSAVIEPKIIKLDQNRVNLVYEITEGQETLITRINFVGNEHFSDENLKTVVRSQEGRWYRFWNADDKYDQDRLAYDRELLRRFYIEHGYADFQVDAAVAELTPDRRDFFVTFSINEGERYKVGKIDIQTTLTDLDAEKLRPSLTFKAGEWYKASEIENSITKMTDQLGNIQFAFVDIRPGVVRNRKDLTIDITFNIGEGQKTFINNINISGNSRTLDEVVRREMTLVEGDPFNADKLKKSEQNVKDLNFFETAEVKPVATSDPSKTDIEVKVEEKSTGELSIGAGYSTNDGALADFRVKEKNFLGKGQELSFSTTLAQKRTQFDFSFTEPYFLKRDLSAGIDLFNITRDLQDQSSYDSELTGAGLRLGYPLSEKWRQGLVYRYEASNISNIQAGASNFIKQQAGEWDTSLVSQTLTYDTRDSKNQPTEGTIGRITTDLAGLGGNAKYWRVRAGGTHYSPIVNKWVFSILGEVGYIEGWNDNTVRINDRFYLGGDTMRGFEDAGIGPRDILTGDALGGNQFWRGSLELEFPTGLPDELGVRAHAFSDFGSLWSVDSSGPTVSDTDVVRVSTGLGVSWQSPFGPVRVDLGRPIIKQTYDKLQQFRLSFGTRF